MIARRLILALPLLALPARAQTAGDLAPVLIACWAARGVRFTVEQVTQRIGARTGRAALLAVGGSAQNADGDDEETVVEILWEAGQPPLPTAPAMARDLARGLPLLLITRDGRALLLIGTDAARLHTPGGALTWADAALIGRPVIAGA
jgi:hypothetical protein